MKSSNELRRFGRKEAGANPPEQDRQALLAEYRRVSDEIKQFAEAAHKEIKSNGELSRETRAKVDEALVKQGELQARLSELEQKMHRRGGGERDDRSVEQSAGEIVVADQGMQALMKSRSGKARVSMKAITSLDASGGALVGPQRLPGIVGLPERRLTVRDLLTPGTTSSNSIEYVRETGFTNNADIVTEAALKPESNITFELVTAAVRTIAHWLSASVQILEDAPQLQSFIDGRLRYGLMFVEEQQLLKGSGTGNDLQGIIPVASTFAPAFAVPNQTAIDELRLALLQAELAEYPATGIVLHPTDWARVELTKTSEGAYIFSNPTADGTPRLWGRPVVATQAVDVGEFVVGAFRLGAQVFDRRDAVVQVSTEDSDNFRRNMVTIRAEERLTLAIYRPEAFVTGQLSMVT